MSKVLSHCKFTGKDRDAESGLDDFGARYYASTIGRFMSPDDFTGGPLDLYGPNLTDVGPLPYANIFNPQSLNKYGYTYDNPLRYIDPDGHDIDFTNDDVEKCSTPSGTSCRASTVRSMQRRQITT